MPSRSQRARQPSQRLLAVAEAKQAAAAKPPPAKAGSKPLPKAGKAQKGQRGCPERSMGSTRSAALPCEGTHGLKGGFHDALPSLGAYYACSAQQQRGQCLHSPRSHAYASRRYRSCRAVSRRKTSMAMPTFMRLSEVSVGLLLSGGRNLLTSPGPGRHADPSLALSLTAQALMRGACAACETRVLTCA